MRGLFRKPALRWGAAYVLGVAIALLSAQARCLKDGAESLFTLRYLSDGCFVSAVIISGLGLLVWISTTGVFDIFSYGVSSLLTLFTSLRAPKDQISYLDYKTFKAEKRQKARWELLIAGGTFFLLSIAFLLAYNGTA